MKPVVFGLICFILACSSTVQGQDNRPELPFYIDSTKRLPEFELAEKKEGLFVTGVPRVQFDPIRGFGIGGNVNLFINKDRQDPFFDYTPYRHRVNAEFFIFQNGRIRYAFNYDAPYIFNSKWRLRADLVHWEDPHAQYWGIGRYATPELRFRDKNTGENRRFRRIWSVLYGLSLSSYQPKRAVV